MNNESSTDSWFERNSWIFSLIVSIVTFLIFTRWFFRNYEEEPLSLMIISFGSILTTLLSRGIKGVFFTMGLFTASVIILPFLYYSNIYIPQLNSKLSEKTEQELIQLKKENEELKNEVIEKEKKAVEIQTNNSETAELRRQISELQTENQNLKERLSILTETSGDKATLKSEVVDDVLIEIVSCRSTGSDVEIELKITNRGQDRNLRFDYSSSLTNEKDEKFTWEDYFNDKFVNNVRRNLKLVFKQAGQSKNIQLLEIKFEKNSVQFRDIAVQR